MNKKTWVKEEKISIHKKITKLQKQTTILKIKTYSMMKHSFIIICYLREYDFEEYCVYPWIKHGTRRSRIIWND